MKKIPLKASFFVFIVIFSVRWPFAFAQTLTRLPVTSEPAATNGSIAPLTNVTTPVQTGGNTQINAATNPNTAGTTTFTSNNAGNPTMLSGQAGISEVPSVPELTQESTQQTSPNPASLVCTSDKCSAAISQAGGNQVIFATIFFIGGIIGGIIWIFGLLLTKNQVIEREARRMERENTRYFKKILTQQKMAAFSHYTNSVASILAKLKQKIPSDKADIKSFQQDSVFIEMHGSLGLRNVNNRIAEIIASRKAPSPENYEKLKNELIRTLRADLLGRT